jgi:hypothetical protein
MSLTSCCFWGCVDDETAVMCVVSEIKKIDEDI